MYNWGLGNTIGKIYVVDEERVGNNKYNPKHGTLALCVEHTGDCFFDYIPIFKDPKGMLSLLTARRFGSYTFSEQAKIQVTTEQFHLLMAGRKVRVCKKSSSANPKGR